MSPPDYFYARALTARNVLALSYGGRVTDFNGQTSRAPMDHSTKSIAEFATRLDYADLPAEVVHDCKRRIIDTIGCAIAAFDEEPARIARAVAMRAQVAGGASVIGTPHRTLPELAAFANSVASRYLEGNDTYPGGGGHPNDNLLPVLAIAQASGASAQTAITAIVLAYEVHRYLFRAFPMRKHALDYVLYNAVASAAGSAKVLGLSLPQTAHAIALAAVPNLGTDISRRGHLTMWKGCAAANAARNGVFAAIMASEGMAGPPTPFEDGLTAVIGAEEICPFPVDADDLQPAQGRLQVFPQRVSRPGAGVPGAGTAAADQARRHREDRGVHLSLRLVRDRQRRGEMEAHHPRDRRPQHALCGRGRADRRRLHRRDLCAGAIPGSADARR